MRRSAKRKGYVYFIGPEASFFRKPDDVELCVKIGFTEGCPYKRLSTFAVGSPLVLEMIAYCEGSMEMEQAFHRTFAELRAHGEWFFLQCRLRSFLESFDRTPKNRFIDRASMAEAIFEQLLDRVPPPVTFFDTSDWHRTANPEEILRFFPEILSA